MRQLTATGFWRYTADPAVRMKASRRWHVDSRPASDATETLLNEQRFPSPETQQPEVAEQLWRDAALDLQNAMTFLPCWQEAEKPGADQNIPRVNGNKSEHSFGLVNYTLESKVNAMARRQNGYVTIRKAYNRRRIC